MKNKIITIVLLLTLIFAVLLGTTKAYFVDNSERPNKFTMSEGIDILLAEPKWDNLDYDGNIIKELPTILGSRAAQNIVQGRIIPKNPSVKNSSQLDDAWIAIKLEYYKIVNDENGQPVRVLSSYEEIDEIAEVDWVGQLAEVPAKTALGNWTTVTGSAIQTNTIFYYDTKVPAQFNTTDLFEQIAIQLYKHSLDQSGNCIYDVNGIPVYNTAEYVKRGDLFQFEIVVKAYGVQEDNVDFENAKTLLYELMTASP